MLAVRNKKNRQGWRAELRRIVKVGGQNQEESSKLTDCTKKNRQSWLAEPRRIAKIADQNQEE